MARKKKELPLLQSISIEGIAGEGKALTHVNGQVLFVPFAAPGDVCDIQVTKKKSSFMEGRITEIITPSPQRVTPFCSHFTICGGCKWQHLPYSLQLETKDQVVRDALCRIGKIDVGTYLPILGSERTERYRNKLEFTFSHRRWLQPEELSVLGEKEEQDLSGLGFHLPGMFDKVLDIDQCHLGAEVLDDIRLFIRDYCKARPERYPYFDLRKQEGFMRTLMMRTTSTGEIMLVVVFFREDEEARTALLDAVKEHLPQITSLLYVINAKANDTITDQEIHCYSGRDYIEEQMEGLTFRIGPKSFYQTNSEQAYELYKVAREFAELTGKEHVYDLYTGTGTIANFVARNATSVIGIEYVPEAIADAKINSEVNGIDNTLFYAGDMKDILTEDFILQHGRPEVIITDPPRAGMHEDVITTILRAAPQRIVYVSCNPATQARDLQLLTASGDYRVTKSRAVDMFPHTHHIENVVQLVRHVH
ncbi:23S rRNA (uracil(1939)-C(5))-methyltransferase RlmD [Porphyromonas catoniae]|uniref:23S rRNA (uracil(1939)-C(5))-methyltransferase RlmD n=1 Tax=Porphyromonas catoniae TaxID=41976 RepID=UPI0028D778E8|nr:23S rRNA (uracil(1939)-C(5))-methyltransferase RlmD [Porphyromonas catoniae]